MPKYANEVLYVDSLLPSIEQYVMSRSAYVHKKIKYFVKLLPGMSLSVNFCLPLAKIFVLLFVLCIFVIVVIFPFRFEGNTLVLIATVPGHCLLLYFYLVRNLAGRT